MLRRLSQLNKRNVRNASIVIAALSLLLIGVNNTLAQASDPDLDNDGTVTGQDVKIVSTCLGKKGPSNPNCQFELADTDGDGDVDNDDLKYVADHLGESGYPTG